MRSQPSPCIAVAIHGWRLLALAKVAWVAGVAQRFSTPLKFPATSGLFEPRSDEAPVGGGELDVAVDGADLDPQSVVQAWMDSPGSSPLDKEKRKGFYVCAGCALPLFASTTKYDSGTGWPSFTAPLRGAIGTRPDNMLFMKRTEVHCRRCGGPLGHVFDDGPRPTGKRYCMNGVAMKFIPA